MNKKLEILTIGIAFTTAICNQSRAEITRVDILNEVFGEPIVYQTNGLIGQTGAVYQNDNGSKAHIGYEWGNGSSTWGNQIVYHIRQIRTDNTTNSTSWQFANVTINGEVPTWTTPRSNTQTFDFDENGKIKAWYNASGTLLRTYKYAENGQLLAYDTQGNLIGAFNNFNDQLMHAQGGNYYYSASGLNNITEDGSYTAKDGDKILGIYQRDGSKTEYQYDAGGNLIKISENGVVTYRRRIYTPAEATAAVQKGGKNNFSIIYR